MSFQKLLKASLKEFVRDRTSLSFTIILPLMLVAFFGFAYGSGTSHMTVGIVGHPRPAASAVRVLHRTPSVRIEYGARSVEMARLRDGTIGAVVVFNTPTNGSSRLPDHVYFERGDGANALAAQDLANRLGLARGKVTAGTSPSRTTVGAVGGSQNGRLDFVIPGILATAIMWLGIFAAIPLVQQREQQVLRRFAVTPLSRARLILSQVSARLLISLAQAAFVLLAARALFGVPVGARLGSLPMGILVVSALVLLGALAFVAIGYAIASLNSTQHGAHAWAQLLSMPMLLLAGVFFPVAVMPPFLRPLIALLPLTYLADALRQTSIAGQHFAPLSIDLAVLGVWILLPIGISLRYFRWT